VRTLLVASQKGGVGKTTTAINLAALAAQSGQRVLILDADPLGSVVTSLHLSRLSADDEDRPAYADPVTSNGAYWLNAIENLDVVSPYSDDDTSEEILQTFLEQMSGCSALGQYDLILIDAPPMLGPRPKALLRVADEVLIVQRAEPMSFRTLPAYLDLLNEVRKEGAGVKLGGILLTLPNGLVPGSKAEQKLRERFPGLLPISIPHDSEVNQALLLGQPVVSVNPESLAAKRYGSLAKLLNLTQERIPVAVGTRSYAKEAAFTAVKTPQPVAHRPVESRSAIPPKFQKAIPMSNRPVESRSAIPPKFEKPIPTALRSALNVGPLKNQSGPRLKSVETIRIPLPQETSEPLGLKWYLTVFAVMIWSAATGLLVAYLMR